MKKNFLLLPCLLLLFSACQKIEKVLPKDDGAWLITEKTSLRYENGELQSELKEFDQGYIQFEEDGTGVMELLGPWGAAPLDMDWTYDKETNILNITLPAVSEFYDYEIIESKKKTKTLLWGMENENSGLLQRTELKLKLEKAE